MARCTGRRKFLVSAGNLVPALAIGVASRSVAASSVVLDIPGSLSLHLLALHTMESVSLPYWEEGHYIEENLSQINHLLRDHRTDEVCAIDTKLLEYVYSVTRELEVSGPVEVLSGYRSAATNEKLRRRSNAVAKRSFHMFGRAVDIRIPGVSTTDLRNAAVSLRLGGVGYYPRPGFVHLDTGRVRRW